MSKGRALLETFLVSVIIPVIMWSVSIFALTRFYRGYHIVVMALILATVLYVTVVFKRPKELGGWFVFFMALFSCAVQFAAGMLMIVLIIPDKPFGGEGHPNGDAILLMVMLVLEPFILNIGAFVIWLIKKIIWLFKKED